jgi:hypothetical protein
MALDSGRPEIIVAIPPARNAPSVRALGTCTPDLHARVDWLVEHGIDPGARESPGVEGLPIYELWARRGSPP